MICDKLEFKKNCLPPDPRGPHRPPPRRAQHSSLCLRGGEGATGAHLRGARGAGAAPCAQDPHLYKV